jgi:hypothetical protein
LVRLACFIECLECSMKPDVYTGFRSDAMGKKLHAVFIIIVRSEAGGSFPP